MAIATRVSEVTGRTLYRAECDPCPDRPGGRWVGFWMSEEWRADESMHRHNLASESHQHGA